MTNDKSDLEWVSQIARSASMRSRWGQWLVDHHDEFETALSYKPLWENLLEKLSTQVLGDENGAIELPDEWWSDDFAARKKTRRRIMRAAQKVWERVHAKEHARPSQAAAMATAGTLPGIGGGAVRDAGIEPEEPVRRTFQPVRPK